MVKAIMDIREETPSALAEYGEIPIAFTVESRYRVEQIEGGLGGMRLVEEAVATPYVKDYDAISGEGPTRWAKRWDLSNWGVLSAHKRRQREFQRLRKELQGESIEFFSDLQLNKLLQGKGGRS